MTVLRKLLFLQRRLSPQASLVRQDELLNLQQMLHLLVQMPIIPLVGKRSCGCIIIRIIYHLPQQRLYLALATFAARRAAKPPPSPPSSQPPVLSEALVSETNPCDIITDPS